MELNESISSDNSLSIPKGDVPMAFNNVGVFSIAPGQTIDWTCAWSWSGGDGDHGAQYFSAHPIDRQAVLIMSDQSKCRGDDNHISYGFKVTSHSPRTVFFSVQGGGFS
jgi:hypothetical protein